MKNALKAILRSAVPGLYAVLQKTISGRSNRRLGDNLTRVAQLVANKQGFKVAAGPFAGMSYLERALKLDRSPMLVGSFESELHEIVNKIVAARYEVIVDIGCAEGYYAIGFALRLKAAMVYAFDIEENAQRLCREMASLNQVADRVTVRGECDVQWLQSLPEKRVLIFSDCEGAEIGLLNPDLAPRLARCDLLVELHDCWVPGVSSEIQRRFTPSHDITLIRAQPRNPSGYPHISFLSRADQHLAVMELRTGIQEWAFLTAKHRSASA